eukprot:COSAG04_NODE_987_length_8947_cov_6.409245_10_plen_472_part_00
MAAERRELREALDDTSAQLTLLREAGAQLPRLEGSVAKIEAALGALLPELRQEEEEGVLQANPLVLEGDEKAQVGSAGDDEEEALVPLDPEGALLKLLERAVYGPCGGPGSAGQYAYLASTALLFCVAGYFSAGCFALIDPSLELAGWAIGIMCLLMAGTMLLGLRPLSSHVADGGALREMLLGAEVGAQTAADVADTVRKNMVGMIAVVPSAYGFWGFILYMLWEQLTLDITIAGAFMICLMWQVAFVAPGAPTAVFAACATAEDSARRLARLIKTTPAAAADFDELLRKIDGLGQDTDRAAQVAAKQQLYQLVLGFSFAALGAIFALGPRPDDPEHWWNVLCPPWLCLLAAGGRDPRRPLQQPAPGRQDHRAVRRRARRAQPPPLRGRQALRPGHPHPRRGAGAVDRQQGPGLPHARGPHLVQLRVRRAGAGVQRAVGTTAGAAGAAAGPRAGRVGGHVAERRRLTKIK